MSKMTFVVEYPDGEEPAICKGMNRNGGKQVSASFTDLSEENEKLEERIEELEERIEELEKELLLKS